MRESGHKARSGKGSDETSAKKNEDRSERDADPTSKDSSSDKFEESNVQDRPPAGLDEAKTEPKEAEQGAHTTQNGTLSSAEEHESAFKPYEPKKSRFVDIFIFQEAIGHGTYGNVIKATHIETSEKVALKKLKLENEREGFPVTAIREIRLLSNLKHENIIDLKEIVVSKANKQNQGRSDIYLVFSYMDYDLSGLNVLARNALMLPHIKYFLKQFLKGLVFLHKNGVLHRDLKCANLLVNKEGVLKIADFGLGREIGKEKRTIHYTNKVCTLWNRPPELLLGAVSAEQYSFTIDIWSVGCILLELLTGTAPFRGKVEVDQLEQIFKVMGTPTLEDWPELVKLPLYSKFKELNLFKKKYPRILREKYSHLPDDALNILEKMLSYRFTMRPMASQLYLDPFLVNDPIPEKPKTLPTKSCHEIDVRRERKVDSRSRPASGQRGATSAVVPGPIQSQPHTSVSVPAQGQIAAEPKKEGELYGRQQDQQQRRHEQPQNAREFGTRKYPQDSAQKGGEERGRGDWQDHRYREGDYDRRRGRDGQQRPRWNAGNRRGRGGSEGGRESHKRNYNAYEKDKQVRREYNKNRRH